MSGEDEAGRVEKLLETREGLRIAAADREGWRRWGPYLSERQWGTVREDYSADGSAWEYLPHDHARSRAYRWGEDGIAGFSDERQLWCLSLGLWNGRDPILKERMFGLNNAEGTHGEDAKDLWWYLDGVPSHAYLRMLYKYPQARFPYEALLSESLARKGTMQPEYKLADTGVFDEGRYFDVGVEYAKASPDDILMRIEIVNRGPDRSSLRVLPQLLARNTWSWTEGHGKPGLAPLAADAVAATMPGQPPLRFSALQPAHFLFCENETNTRRLDGTQAEGAFKDAINDHILGGGVDDNGLPGSGTKCAALTILDLAPGETAVLRYRLAPETAAALDVTGFEAVVTLRKDEVDEFYAVLQRDIGDPDARLVQRQALAGLIWSKQFYHYDVRRWLAGDPAQPAPPPERENGRNKDWTHLNNGDVIAMPDKWEYPWYASWDLAFQAVAMSLVDPGFAKTQLLLLTREWFMHPSGQLPAYEWAFSDSNPPVQAWAALRVYKMDAALTGVADREFLERAFHKLLVNFTWWVNRKDMKGRNLFEGGFLGLDNIGVFDRSQPLPDGAFVNQADGTAWMAMYALNMMRIALELAIDNPAYQDIASKFFEHFLYIAEAAARVGEEGRGLWDEVDQFYYDVLERADGSQTPLRIRSLVGLIPLCAVEVLDSDLAERFPAFAGRMQWLLKHCPELGRQVSRWMEPGKEDRFLLSLLRRSRMKALLNRMLDETEFLSDHGVRSLSQAHRDKPFTLDWEHTCLDVTYAPGVSDTPIFGGNSNWRGPVWMPVNFMLIEALCEFERFYGEDFVVPCPTGAGADLDLNQIAAELTRRLTTLFLRDPNGRRPVHGERALYQDDPHFRDNITFHEFFHAETGAGLGASHQTGWTSLIALLLQPRAGGRIRDGADAESPGFGKERPEGTSIQ